MRQKSKAKGKRILGVVLALVFLISCIMTPDVHAQAESMIIALSARSVKIGDTLAVTVTLPAGVTGTVNLTYSKELFTYQSATAETSVNAGTVSMTLGSYGSGNKRASGTVKFKADAAGTASFAASAPSAGNQEGDRVDVGGASVSVAVENSAAAADDKSKDNQLAIMHVNTIDRTSDGKGKVSDYTLAELRKFHLKNGLGRVTFHPIPTLEEVLELTKGKILINIDKGYDYFQEVYKLLVKTQTIDQVVIKSGYAYEKVKAENGDVLDKVIYMPIVDLNNPDAEAFIEGYRQMKPVAMECCFSEVTPEVLRLLQKVKDNGSKIWLNGLWPSLNGGHDDDRAVELNQKDESWGWLLEKGASLIQTDRPVQLLQYLKEEGRR